MTVDENKGQSKEQSGPPPESHDLRSGNVPPTNARAEAAPPPTPKLVVSHEDKERFAKEAFAHIRRSLVQALRDFEAQDSAIKTELIDAGENEFTARIHWQGVQRSACIIRLGDDQTIHYTGEGNPYQDVLTVDDSAGERLHLRINDMSIMVQQRLVTVEQAAQHLWKQLAAPLGTR